MFRKLLDNTKQNSLANKFRKKRHKYLENIIKDIDPPVCILDVGGTENFWKQMGVSGNNNFRITILNINTPKVSEEGNMKFIKGNAADLSVFKDKSFDIVFSNSVIEHIPVLDDRKKMADEIMRVGVNYFVQTPNYYFLFEPHFLFPFFQFFPFKFKIFILMHFNMGWFKKCKDKTEALELLRNNQLLKLNEFRDYFKSGNTIKEKFLFLNKSFIAMNK